MSMERRDLPARRDLVQRRTQALGPSLCPDRCRAEKEGGLVAFELPLWLKDICDPLSVTGVRIVNHVTCSLVLPC
jgi:hypothetical protein